jgi:hypothetical protein
MTFSELCNWEFGRSKVKVVATHFRKMLANDEKVEQILNNIMD